MYRSATVQVTTGDDSNLTQKGFDRKATFYQTKDQEEFSTVRRVAPADSEATVSIAPVTTGYFIGLYSDYPVKVRINGASATQFTMRSNNVSAVNVGAPLPDQCCFVATMEVTELRLEPIASASQTANVRIVITGDPTSAYV